MKNSFQQVAHLGIVIEEHMSKIIINANSKLGIIKNTFHELTKYNFIILYKAFVRPILEYCCTTWAHILSRTIKKLRKYRKGTLDFKKLNSRPSRYNSQKLIKPRALTSHKQFSFSHRVINNWNELPDSVVLADNLYMFKRNFDFFWKDNSESILNGTINAN